MAVVNIPEIGTKMRLKIHPIEGVITEKRFDPDGKIECRVPFMGEDGENHERWFTLDQLEEIIEEIPNEQ